ncbi:MAG TPA: hypothetical protein VHK69_15275 [Chitinophagaceae bacterium]|jgi:hypothetical protein|nr:hypothetical protein [Chitinophagaceae bacterium]
MKLLLFLSAIIPALTLVSFAADKEQPAPPKVQPRVSGSWHGFYALEEGPHCNEWILDFDSAGRLAAFNGPKEWGDRGYGKYTISNDTLYAWFRYAEGLQDKVEIHAAFRAGTDSLSGSWSWVNGKGTFRLRKEG